VFEDFLTLNDELTTLKTEDTRDDARDILRRRSASLASRLTSLDCKTPIQRLCQGEMSKRVCHLLRVLLTEAEQLEMAKVIAEFPMPDDSKLDELRYLLILCANAVVS